MSYAFNSADVFDFATFIGAETKQVKDELKFKECPYCHSGNSKADRYSFSINLEHGAFKCPREDNCGKQGHFVQLCRDFDYQLDFGEAKEYRQLSQPTKEVEPSGMAMFYLGTRHISDEVVKRYSVTTRKDNENILAFPFFDENGVLQFIKYRNMNFNHTGPKEWCEKGTKPIFYGMKQCVNFDRVIITEGQIDSLSVASCGFDNCISVSNGANSVSSNVANCYEWITKFKEVVVFGDWEYKRGDRMTLLDDLMKRLPPNITIKAVQKKDYLGEKDANDILTEYGPDAIRTCIDSAKTIDLDFIEGLENIRRENLSKLPKIRTNIKELDTVIGGGLLYSKVYLLSGQTGEGKSTFLSQIILEAVEQDIKTFVYSGELPGADFKLWFDLQCAGQRNIKAVVDEYGTTYYEVPDDVLDKIENWYSGKVKVYNNKSIISRDNKNGELDSLLIRIEKAIKRYDIKLVCLDNLMTAVEVDQDGNLYTAQTDFMKKLKWLAETYNVVVILVAHPKKINPKEGFTNDSISGASEVTKLSDMLLVYSRNKDPEQDHNGNLEIIKNRVNGYQTGKEPLKFYYNKMSKRITSKGTPYRQYGWEFASLADDSFELPY